MSGLNKAAADLEALLVGRQKNMMEQIGRCGRGELFILKYLYDKNTADIPSHISEAMHTSTARISAALNSLEKKGQIRREIDTSNRRNILVTITQEGRQRILSDMQQMREQMIGILAKMGEGDASELVRLIQRFLEISDRELCKQEKENPITQCCN